MGESADQNSQLSAQRTKSIKKYRSQCFQVLMILFLYFSHSTSRGTEFSKKSRHRHLLDNRSKYARIAHSSKRPRFLQGYRSRGNSGPFGFWFVENLCISLSASVSTVVTTKIDK